MILLGKIIQLLAKMIVLLLVVTFEFTVGHPVLFITLIVSFLLTARPLSRYALFIVAVWIFSSVYDISIFISFGVIAGMYFGFKYTSQYLESNIRRFFIYLLFSLSVIHFSVQVPISFWSMFYLGSALLISFIFLVKFLFANYGFLGTKMQSKYTFFR